MLHHDSRWTHEGQPIRNTRLRDAFDRAVRFLPDEKDEDHDGKYVVQLGHFRGQIEIEEAGFFVRDYDPPTGTVTLSDRSAETLDVASLRQSPIDQALLCKVKRDLVPDGLAARFSHAAQSELLNAVEEEEGGAVIRFGDTEYALPDLDDGR